MVHVYFWHYHVLKLLIFLHTGLLDLLNEMNSKLEAVQKSLDMYLETKRQFFPRFYFLSNDDLLEILGQSKNPEAVQPHMKKCFDNIKSLDMAKMRDHHEATHMNSAEGEKVDFKTIVRLEGPVEVRLDSMNTRELYELLSMDIP